MKHQLQTGLALVLGLGTTVYAATYTVAIDADAAGNALADQGFESMSGTQPDSVSAPWFTIGENADANFTTATNVTHGGARSALFASYFDQGAIVQNLGLQVDAGLHYQASVWMLTGEISGNAAHTNSPAIHLSIYTSPTLGGSYSYRAGFFFNQENSATNVWELFSGSIEGSSLAAYVGEYIQIRIVKVNGNSTHRMYIDDAVLMATGAAVDKMAMGTGLVYSWEADALYADGQISRILKDIGIGTLRWPGGTVVTHSHWDALTGNGWADSWNPAYNHASDKPPSTYMDIDEYLALIDSTGAEIMLGVNMSSGKEWNRQADGIAEASNLMLYCQSKGYDVKYVYFDNESYLPSNGYNKDVDGDGGSWSASSYGQSFKLYAAAVKAVYPNAKLIANWENKVNSIDFSTDMNTMLTQANGTIDYVDIHCYWRWDEADWDTWKSQKPMQHNNTGLSYKESVTHANGVFASLGYPNVKTAVMEWNLGPGPWQTDPEHTNFRTALMQSEMQLQFLQAGLDIGLLYAMQGPNVPTNKEMHILHDATPNATALWMWLFSKAIGKTLVQSSSPVAGVDILSVRGSRGEWIVYLLNKTDGNHTIEFDVTGDVFTTVNEAWRFKDNGSGSGTLENINLWQTTGKWRTTLQANTVNMIGFNYADEDADGIDDAWEIDHFGTTSAADAFSDADRDGVSDYDEALSQTDPNDPLSCLRMLNFSVTKKPTGNLLIGWDTTANGGDYALQGMSGALLLGNAYGMDTTAGSTDGTFGNIVSGAVAGVPAYAVRTAVPGSTDTVGIRIENGTGFDVQLETLHFDYSPYYSGAPRDVTLVYAGGDLGVTAGTVINAASAIPVAGKIGDYNDFDWALTSLTDRVLSTGETATFNLIASNASGATTGGAFDNIAVSGQTLGADYSTSLSWHGHTGRKYQVMHTTNLVSGVWQSVTAPAVGTPVETTVITGTDELPAYYRLEVVPY